MVGWEFPHPPSIDLGDHIRTAQELVRAYARYSRQAHLWFAENLDLFTGLEKVREARGTQHRLLVLGHPPSSARLEYLRMFFRSVDVLGASDGCAAHVSEEELAEILATDYPDEYILQAVVDFDDEVVLLLRGNLERLAVPFEWFLELDPKHVPDFENVRIEDYGQTLELGEHDVAIDAILYEFDPEYRARLHERSLKRDDSFGGALRRLRRQRGLSQTDFAPVSERQIRRIETGETTKPRDDTLEVIADRLGVQPEEIATY